MKLTRNLRRNDESDDVTFSLTNNEILDGIKTKNRRGKRPKGEKGTKRKQRSRTSTKSMPISLMNLTLTVAITKKILEPNFTNKLERRLPAREKSKRILFPTINSTEPQILQC